MKVFIISCITGFIFLLLFLIVLFSFKPATTNVTVINNESCCGCTVKPTGVSLGDYDETI